MRFLEENVTSGYGLYDYLPRLIDSEGSNGISNDGNRVCPIVIGFTDKGLTRLVKVETRWIQDVFARWIPRSGQQL